MTDSVDGTATEVSTELVPAGDAHAQPPVTLFRTDDPVEVVTEASRVADALKRVIDAKKLTSKIGGREHVRVEGWQTLGSMLGVVPVVVWTRELPNGNGWEARVEARTLDGRVVGAAEAMCSKDERTWKSRDPYALRSMAQTRATSKALRGPLGFVVTLAGYDATPAEEIPAEPDTGYGQPPEQPRASGKVSPSAIRNIYEHAAGLTHTQLLNAIRSVAGRDPLVISEHDAKVRLDAGLVNLAADKVPAVLQAIRDVRDGDQQ